MVASPRQLTRTAPAHGGEATITVLHPRRSAHEATAQLVRRAADGDEAAWTAVVEEYGSLVWSVARGFRLSESQAADAVQTTWLRLLENIGTIRDPERLAGWLRTTTRRACLETIRRTGRELPSDPHGHETGAAIERAAERPDGNPEEHLLRQEQVTLVRSAVQQLPERSRQLLELLMASPPLSYEEIGTRMEMPVGSIGPTRARLMTRLRTTLAAAGVADAA
jgi:RNA polymerase sigma factor (sigma-70 family)